MGTTQASFFLRQPAGSSALSVVGRLLTILAGGVIVVVGLMFSLAAVAIALVAGLLLFLYLKWRTRHLRQRLREQYEQHAQHSPEAERSTAGRVIEGEVLAAEYETPAGEPARRLDTR